MSSTHPELTYASQQGQIRMRTRHSSTAVLQPNPVLSHCHVSRIKNSSDSPSRPCVLLGLKSRIFGYRSSVIMPAYGSCVAMQGSEKHYESVGRKNMLGTAKFRRLLAHGMAPCSVHHIRQNRELHPVPPRGKSNKQRGRKSLNSCDCA